MAETVFTPHGIRTLTNCRTEFKWLKTLLRGCLFALANALLHPWSKEDQAMCKLSVWGFALLLLTFLPALASAREYPAVVFAVGSPYVASRCSYRYRACEDWRWRRYHRDECRHHHRRHRDRDPYWR
jgi:hypothetical protein